MQTSSWPSRVAVSPPPAAVVGQFKARSRHTGCTGTPPAHEGVVDEGWEIDQLLELNGSMRSQGWYPPPYVGDIQIAKSDWDSSAFGKAAYESQKQEV